jgi:hypothetical protein
MYYSFYNFIVEKNNKSTNEPSTLKISSKGRGKVV